MRAGHICVSILLQPKSLNLTQYEACTDIRNMQTGLLPIQLRNFLVWSSGVWSYGAKLAGS